MLRKILTVTGVMALGLAMALPYAHIADARGGRGNGGGKGMGQRGGEALDRLDTDGNGQVSRTEYDAHFGTLDLNGDGNVTEEEFVQARTDQRNKRRTERFEADDADKDGKVSRDEFSGPSKAFSRIDSDGDGYISEAESLAFQPVRDRMGGRGMGQGGQGGPGMGQGQGQPY